MNYVNIFSGVFPKAHRKHIQNKRIRSGRKFENVIHQQVGERCSSLHTISQNLGAGGCKLA